VPRRKIEIGNWGRAGESWEGSAKRPPSGGRRAPMWWARLKPCPDETARGRRLKLRPSAGACAVGCHVFPRRFFRGTIDFASERAFPIVNSRSLAGLGMTTPPHFLARSAAVAVAGWSQGSAERPPSGGRCAPMFFGGVETPPLGEVGLVRLKACPDENRSRVEVETPPCVGACAVGCHVRPRRFCRGTTNFASERAVRS